MVGFPFDSALTYDEHDNPIYDRAISSQPLRELLKRMFSTGVMPNPSTNFQVQTGTDGLTVRVQPGFAVVDGGLCKEESIRTLAVTGADSTYDRIDTVVIRWNENTDVRMADLYIVAGTPAANPVRPELQRDNSIYEIGLADIFVTRGVATITADKITDTRYESSRCGIVSSVSEWDTTTIYQQVQADLASFKTEEQAEFLAWFATIQDILDQSTAGHLQNEIDAIIASLTASDDLRFRFVKNPEGDDYGYLDENGDFVPFRTTHSQTKTITTVGTTDMGVFHKFRYVKTSGLMKTPTAALTINANGNNIDVLNYKSVNVAVPKSSLEGPIQAKQERVDSWHGAWITVSDWSKYRGFCAVAWAGNAVGGISWGNIYSNGTFDYIGYSDKVYVEISGNSIRATEAIMSNVTPFLIIF